MPKPILAVQLYSVRDALAENPDQTLDRVAELGYQGVEVCGVYGPSIEWFRKACESRALEIVSAHLPPDLDTIRRETEILGVCDSVIGWLPAERFKTNAGVQEVADELNALATALQPDGITLHYHNHDFEFRPTEEGDLPHHLLQTAATDNLRFEVDTYWIWVPGQDPAVEIARASDKITLLHVKDGNGKVFLPAGEGSVDLPPAIQAAASATSLIVELDSYEGDIFDALATSADFLRDGDFVQ